MRALIIVESLAGNTRAVAQAIATGLVPTMEVTTVDVAAAGSTVPDDVDLLLVGAPTHAHGLSRPGTRRSVAVQKESGHGDAAIGVREWLAGLHAKPGTPTVTFDTRLSGPRWLTGSAARSAARRLAHLGLQVAAPAESFIVHGSPGSLDTGELDRARSWGQQLAANLAGGTRAA